MFGLQLKKYSSALQIRDFAKNNKISKTKSEIRSSVGIAIVDDEKFQAYNNLTSYGYKISEFHDIRNVSELSEFDIVLCDLMGVGSNFDASIGGASIIREIKANFPTKFVVAYTGARANTVEAVAAKEFADAFIKKDADLTRWTAVLDSLIDKVTDPYAMWIVARQGLMDQEIDLREIIKLESAYVKSIEERDTTFSHLNAALKSVDIGGNAKSIVQGLIASTIFRLVLGA